MTDTPHYQDTQTTITIPNSLTLVSRYIQWEAVCVGSIKCM